MLKRLALVTALLVFFASGAMARGRKARFSAFGPVQLDRDGDKWAQRTLKKLTLEEKIGQMLLVWARAEFLNLDSPEFTRLRDMIRKYHLGCFGLTVPVDGPFVLRNQIGATAA